jgi:hypothetical protein
MPQLKEDEWPDAGEQTTTEREAAETRNRADDGAAPPQRRRDDDGPVPFSATAPQRMEDNAATEGNDGKGSVRAE